MRRIFSMLIFYGALTFIALAVASILLAKYSTYEFVNQEFKNSFYNFIVLGLPVCIILTLTGTVSSKNNDLINGAIVIATFIAAAVTFVNAGLFAFAYTVTTISNGKVLYTNKADTNKIIAEQWLLRGAMGDDRLQLVQIEPFFVWQKVTQIDTALINKDEWQEVF